MAACPGPQVLDTARACNPPGQSAPAACRFWALLLLTVGLNFFSFKVRGWHHVAAAERLRAIICFNHVSYLDGIVIGSIFAPCGVAKVSSWGVWHPLRLRQWHTGLSLCALLVAEGSDRGLFMLLVALASVQWLIRSTSAPCGAARASTACIFGQPLHPACSQGKASGVRACCWQPLRLTQQLVGWTLAPCRLAQISICVSMVAHWLHICALHHGRGEHLQ